MKNRWCPPFVIGRNAGALGETFIYNQRHNLPVLSYVAPSAAKLWFRTHYSHTGYFLAKNAVDSQQNWSISMFWM
jgi:hypothetical protein